MSYSVEGNSDVLRSVAPIVTSTLTDPYLVIIESTSSGRVSLQAYLDVDCRLDLAVGDPSQT